MSKTNHNKIYKDVKFMELTNRWCDTFFEPVNMQGVGYKLLENALKYLNTEKMDRPF